LGRTTASEETETRNAASQICLTFTTGQVGQLGSGIYCLMYSLDSPLRSCAILSVYRYLFLLFLCLTIF